MLPTIVAPIATNATCISDEQIVNSVEMQQKEHVQIIMSLKKMHQTPKKKYRN